MVEDNFGPYAGGTGFEQARAYYASRDEAAGAEIADRLGARYVVAAPQGSGQSLSASATRWLRAWRCFPACRCLRSRVTASCSSPTTPTWPASRGSRRGRVAVYEVVRGARVVGRAPAGSRVSFELSLPLGSGPPLRYRAVAAVAATGDYEIRLPHPSDAGYLVPIRLARRRRSRSRRPTYARVARPWGRASSP